MVSCILDKVHRVASKGKVMFVIKRSHPTHFAFATTLFIVALAASDCALAQRTAPVSVSTGATATGSYGSPQFGNGAGTLQYTSQSGCKNCGVVESVQEIKHEGEGSALGTLGGAAVGGAIGRNIGDGKGRVAAGIAGAVIGGVAGNRASKAHNSTTSYQTVVRMDDGSTQTLNQSGAPKWRTGQEVQLNNGTLSPR
jgi:outer membrane lipoprotein SlyB